MTDITPAQQEFNDLVAKNARDTNRSHPEDRDYEQREGRSLDIDEEEAYRASQVDQAMRVPTLDRSAIKLPPASFDAGRTTGVKGVIADARNYEEAKKSSFITKAKHTVRRSIFGIDAMQNTPILKADSDDDDANASDSQDEEAFLAQWRESRRRELESEASRSIRNRRTSPSVRSYGRLDEVDALGYLDAIEKVSRDTIVVVFVYDPECDVSGAIEDAMMPLVKKHNTVHFVKVHYLDIEFDNAAVPSILAYRNQGDIFANLTGIIEMIPDEEIFDTTTLKTLFQKHNIL